MACASRTSSSPTSTPTSSPVISSCAIATGATIYLGRRGEGGVSVHAARRRRRHRARTRAAGRRSRRPDTRRSRSRSSSSTCDRSDTEPHAVLTGDTLFVGDVGRPDLRAALGWSADDLGGLLYDSLHTKLLTLPDASLVYPAHGAGSLCGKAISKETVRRSASSARSNYALQPMSKAAFVELVTADQPDAPSYFTYDAVLNSKERPTLDRNARARAEAADARSGARAAARRRAAARHPRRGGVRRGAPRRAASTSASAASTPRGPAPCSIANIRSSIIADPGASTRRHCASAASASITSSDTSMAAWRAPRAAQRS